MDFAACWDELAKADDAELSLGARVLKTRLRNLVRSVKECP